MLTQPEQLVKRLIAMQRKLRDHVRSQMLAQAASMSDVAIGREDDGDTIYRIDESSEEVLFDECEAWGRETPFILVAEGIPGDGRRAFPSGATFEDGQFILVVDPIDGTREVMFDKRSAWSLAAIAPNLGVETSLADIEVAVQTEISTTRHLYSDTLWAAIGGGAHAERQNLLTGEIDAYVPRPSHASTVAHGFASVVKFFPGTKVAAAQLEENLFAAVLEDGANPLVFDDEYISTGGQIYELIVGHDRFTADLRPIFMDVEPKRLCCHPYDICTELIAREAGIIVTDERGGLLRNSLDIREAVSWIGYANAAVQDELWPDLKRLLSAYVRGN